MVEVDPELGPSSSHAWIASFLEHRLSNDESWACYVACRDGALAGVLPLVIRPVRLAGSRSCALGLPNDLHTISVDLVSEPGQGTSPVHALLSRALDDHPHAAYLRLSRIRNSSPLLQWQKEHATELAAIVEPDGSGAYLDTRPSYEDYRQELSSRFRKNQSYYARQLAKLNGYGVQTTTGAEASPDELIRFINVEASNWKGEAGTAIGSSRSLVEFYQALSRRLQRCGWLRWDFMEAEGKPIAAAFGIRLGCRYVLWKPAYDAQYERLSAGTILIDSLIRSAFEDPNIHEFDLLSDYPYFSKWRVAMRPYYNVRLYPKGTRNLLFHYAPARVIKELRRVPLLRKLKNGLKPRPTGTHE